MNFFQRQAQAKRKTWLLSFYFLVALAGIVTAINIAIYFLIKYSSETPVDLHTWLVAPYWIWVSLAVLGVIAIGSIKTLFQLRGGGPAVAEMANGRRIDPASDDLHERQLINVVEEMSIASGTPMPALYVMYDEPAINAFVAGYKPTEAVLVVTKGSLEQFSRDELQGVIGHEYSHLFNGDTRINMRLMGILGGILLIGQLGHFLMRSRQGHGYHRGVSIGSGSSGRNQKNEMLIGLALFLIGYIGLFFGRLIKAAISRQREFLADASAVQFTRNPDGIASALWRIQEHPSGSRLTGSHSDDLSHFCFGEAVKTRMASLLATHPPLDARIKAINPGFTVKAKRAKAGMAKNKNTRAEKLSTATMSGLVGVGILSDTSDEIVATAGLPRSEHYHYASDLHAALSEAMLTAIHAPRKVPAVIYSLIIKHSEASSYLDCLTIIKRSENAEIISLTLEFLDTLRTSQINVRLPVVNLAIPTLKALPEEDKARILSVLEALIDADRQYSVFEFATFSLLKKYLAVDAEKPTASKYFKFGQVHGEIRLLISAVARAGTNEEEKVRASYALVMSYFTKEINEPKSLQACTMAALDTALRKLALLSPMLKKPLIQACIDCIAQDNKINLPEGELIQAIAEILDCPLPPLIITER